MKPKIRGLSHDHMDGCKCLAPFMPDFYKKAGLEKEFKTTFQSQEKWLEFMRDSSLDIPPRFETITKVLQSKEALTIMAYIYGKHRAEQGYISVEGKFAPQYHTRGGLTKDQAVQAVYNGLIKAQKEFGIKTIPFQICIGREATEDVGLEIAKIALEYDGEIILDLACNEPGNPPEKHLKAYEITFGTNVKRDCHAGEWVDPKPRETYHDRLLKNVKTAILDLKCNSVGHAIPLIRDGELVNHVVDHQIRIAMCPGSNLTLGHIKHLKQLKIDELLDAGVWLTLNPDDDLFLPDMNKVIDQCDYWYSFTRKHCQQLEANAIRPL